MRRTVLEIAGALQIERAAAEGLIKFLLGLGLAEFKGERPSPTGRGKGAYVYTIKDGAAQVVAEMVRKLER